MNSEMALEMEKLHSTTHTQGIPVVFSKAQGAKVWDPEGKEYLDFLSCYSVVNQGHCHPRIVQALITQAQRCTLSSRAFYNDQLGSFEKFLTTLTGFDRQLTMNTGVEAVEAAVKIARLWGYKVKNIPENEAIVLTAQGNFHGRTLAAISMSTDPVCAHPFGPHLPNVSPHVGDLTVKYGNVDSLNQIFEKHHASIAAFLVEPIQGEAGIIVPPQGYLQRVRQLCTEYNILLIFDEIQTGMGRTGKMFAFEHEQNAKPDMVLVGKAVSGGMLPLSAVLGKESVMMVMQPGQHGSTFGGNPLAAAVGREAVQVILDEHLCERAEMLGEILKNFLLTLKQSSTKVKDVRGKGLLQALEFDATQVSAEQVKQFCLALKDAGVLTKPTHGHTIRWAPPLVISKEDLQRGCDLIRKTFDQFF
jgi:ornithine--oxo-acid transaminase